MKKCFRETCAWGTVTWYINVGVEYLIFGIRYSAVMFSFTARGDGQV